EAHARTTGETAVDVRHERGGAFVPRQDKPDGASPQGVHEFQVLFPRDPEREPDPFVLETGDQELRGFHEPPGIARRFISPAAERRPASFPRVPPEPERRRGGSGIRVTRRSRSPNMFSRSAPDPDLIGTSSIIPEPS